MNNSQLNKKEKKFKKQIEKLQYQFRNEKDGKNKEKKIEKLMLKHLTSLRTGQKSVVEVVITFSGDHNEIFPCKKEKSNEKFTWWIQGKARR